GASSGVAWSGRTSSASATPSRAAAARTSGAIVAAAALPHTAAPTSSATTNRGQRTASVRELLIEDAILEAVLGIAQQRHGLLARLADRDVDDVADLVRVGRRADRPLVRIEDLELDLGAGTQDRAAPAARAERTDWRHRQHVGAERQDRAVRG